ncbi:MAG: hypothetical protein ACR2JC_17375 [Chloroflexota bacterium]|nr:MAG: hypothetical protein DLM70_03965 [Chloroflexota bacterium]
MRHAVEHGAEKSTDHPAHTFPYTLEATGTPSGANVDVTSTANGTTTTQYPLTNGSGSMAMVTNASGAPVQTATYDPYGNLTSSYLAALSTPYPYGYAGMLYDATTQLYVVAAGYYDPSTGQGTQVSPGSGGGFTTEAATPREGGGGQVGPIGGEPVGGPGEGVGGADPYADVSGQISEGNVGYSLARAGARFDTDFQEQLKLRTVDKPRFSEPDVINAYEHGIVYWDPKTETFITYDPQTKVYLVYQRGSLSVFHSVMEGNLGKGRYIQIGSLGGW